MSTAPIKVLHLSPWVKTTGGVETLLARHARADAALGFESWQHALFDRTPPRAGEAYSTEAFGWKDTPRSMRARLAASLQRHAGSVLVWQNAWGVPWFADVDHSARRIICLQDSVTHFGPLLPGLAARADGLTCLSRAAAEDIRRGLPGWPEERLVVLPLPLSLPARLAAARPPRDTWVIGCAGRLVKAQKRWDRLVPFVEELRRLGVNYRIEVVSDGPLRPWLQRRLGDDARVAFLGWQERGAYWARLQTWDFGVSFTAHDGGPIVLLEMMAAGAIPLYPQIGGSLGDDYAGEVDPRCHYPAGDPRAAARALQALTTESPAALQALRERAMRLVAPHADDAYERVFAEFVRRIAAAPRFSRAPRGDRPPQWFDRLPLGLLTRVFPHTLRG